MIEALVEDHAQERIKVGTDVDDVVAAHNEVLARFIKEEYGVDHQPDAYHGDLTELWGIESDEAVGRMWAFVRANLHHEMELVPHVTEVIPRMQPRFSFCGVSAQAKAIEEHKAEWLDTRAPELLDEIHFINPYEGDPRTKADVCKAIGAPVLIDNTYSHCLTAVEAGLVAVLFGNQPVPKGAPKENFYPARDWLETEEVLNDVF